MIPRTSSSSSSLSKSNEGKRQSSRVKTLSKAMKIVDEDSRRDFHDRRIMMLEADNYNAEQEISTNDDDYGASEEEDNTATQKKKKMKKMNTTLKSKWTNRKIKSLEKMIMEQGYYDDNNPNYVNIAAGPSKLPMRHFCSVCGYLGKYSCVRCGSRFCSIRCNENHKETRCLQFSI